MRRASDELKKVSSSAMAIGKEFMERANSDPELMVILSDPVILRLLDESSAKPGVDAARLQKAGVAAAKVQKLVDARLIVP